MTPAADKLILETRKEALKGSPFDLAFGEVTVKGIGESLKRIEKWEKENLQEVKKEQKAKKKDPPLTLSPVEAYMAQLAESQNYMDLMNNYNALAQTGAWQMQPNPYQYVNYESQGSAQLQKDKETQEGLRNGRYGLVSQDFEDQFIVLVNKAIEASIAKYNYYTPATVITILYESLPKYTNSNGPR